MTRVLREYISISLEIDREESKHLSLWVISQLRACIERIRGEHYNRAHGNTQSPRHPPPNFTVHFGRTFCISQHFRRCKT